MAVYYIKYEYSLNRWTCVWNREGFPLEFKSREDVEEFIKKNPSSVKGCKYLIVEAVYEEDIIDEMEYGKDWNIWDKEAGSDYLS